MNTKLNISIKIEELNSGTDLSQMSVTIEGDFNGKAIRFEKEGRMKLLQAVLEASDFKGYVNGASAK
jgi:hypothetical protein